MEIQGVTMMRGRCREGGSMSSISGVNPTIARGLIGIEKLKSLG